MYDKSDPRASLATATEGSTLSMTGLVADPQPAYFYRDAPQIDEVNGRTWLHRARNFLVAYSQSHPGAEFTREDQPDEYCVLFPEEGGQITWNGTTTHVAGRSIAFVPAGESTVVMPDGGEVVPDFFTSQC